MTETRERAIKAATAIKGQITDDVAHCWLAGNYSDRAPFVQGVAYALNMLASDLTKAVEALKPFANSYADCILDEHPALWNIRNGKSVVTANHGDLRRAREVLDQLTKKG